MLTQWNAWGNAQERNSPRADFRLLERSVFSDRMVFVRAVHQSKYMSDLELSVYNSWCASAALGQACCALVVKALMLCILLTGMWRACIEYVRSTGRGGYWQLV